MDSAMNRVCGFRLGVTLASWPSPRVSCILRRMYTATGSSARPSRKGTRQPQAVKSSALSWLVRTMPTRPATRVDMPWLANCQLA